MKTPFSALMGRATQLTREQNVMEATREILRGLTGRGRALAPDVPTPKSSRVLELQDGGEPGAAALKQPRRDADFETAGVSDGADARPSALRERRPLGEALKLLRQGDLSNFAYPSPFEKFSNTPTVTVPKGAEYLTRTFACTAGSRDYKLYIPSRAKSRKRPLIIMLHGCSQNPDDFAVGTNMNQLAEDHGFVVAYPKQPTNANQMACWNWFNPQDQMRDMGEPSIIAGLTRAIVAELNIDAERVFVAGLSAGGAMAEIMGATYPELYAATGVHSGLAYGSATDAASAFSAMSGAANASAPTRKRRSRSKGPRRVRTIVFHGASDRKVHPSNGEAIFADARTALAQSAREMRHDGFAGGRSYTRAVIMDGRDVPQVEHWEIDGLGHAWSGGSPQGSHTDRHGPEASREMLRFFLEK